MKRILGFVLGMTALTFTAVSAPAPSPFPRPGAGEGRVYSCDIEVVEIAPVAKATPRLDRVRGVDGYVQAVRVVVRNNGDDGRGATFKLTMAQRIGPTAMPTDAMILGHFGFPEPVGQLSGRVPKRGETVGITFGLFVSRPLKETLFLQATLVGNYAFTPDPVQPRRMALVSEGNAANNISAFVATPIRLRKR